MTYNFHCKFKAHTFSTSDKRILSKFEIWHFRMLWWKSAKFLMSFSKQQVSLIRQFDSSPNFASLFSLMKDYSCSFLAQTIYTLLNRSPLKWNFLRPSSARVKFCQIPYANFETTSWFLSKFLYPSSVSWKITPLITFCV